MSFSLSSGAPLRIAAIVGGFVVLAAGYFLLGPGKPKQASSAEHHLIRHPHGLQSFGKKAAATKAAPAKATGAKKTQPAAATKHEASPLAKPKVRTKAKTAVAAKPKPKVTVKAKPKPARVTLFGSLPDALAAALQQHPVVVVSVYNPHADDDQIAVAEASAGAALAGVGFVGLSVLDQDAIGPITRTLGLVNSPAVLVYERPGRVIARLHGFADRELVAQAVANAAPNAAARG